ncbi:hypothetical protein Tco_0610336 [Tanacetum coccineum]
MAIWDTSVFTLLNSLDEEGFLALQGRWKNISISCLIIVVYAPQDQKKKKKLWSELSRLILTYNSLSVVMGDFTRVRYANERKGSISIHEGPEAKSKNSLGIRRSRNSRFFHGMISSRRNRSRINGLNIQREWVLDLMSIKNHIFEYFDKRFKEVNRARPSFTSNLFKQLSNDEVRFLDCPFTTLEIKDAAFDSLSWSFLLSIMEQIRFSSKWRRWIHSFLNSKFASILINGSPTKEIRLERGEWFIVNAKNLSRILTCFHLASGLKVNFNKSKIFGIGVSYEELNGIASSLGCLASQFPCTYLGLPVGAKMSRCRS